jgi:hypothetical protein
VAQDDTAFFLHTFAFARATLPMNKQTIFHQKILIWFALIVVLNIFQGDQLPVSKVLL